MVIWTFHCYGTLPEHGQMVRHYNFGKHLSEMGHKPYVFVGSHPHNTSLQLIEGKEKYKVYKEEPFPWVLVKTCNYEGSKIKRIMSMFEYYLNARKAAKHFEKPDVVIGSSAHPLVALLGVRLAKKYKAKAVVEIRDLWPESIVSYGILGRHNPIVLILRKLEKWLYVHADDIIFTMEGAYDYIKDQGWGKSIPKAKVHNINNGVDLKQYEYDLAHYTLNDPDLNNDDTFKIVYTGSLRKANEQILPLIDAIPLFGNSGLQNAEVLFYGNGDLVNRINELKEKYSLENVKIKGYVDKKYIPFILSKCDVNVLNCASHMILRYGGSQNKLFDYLASGHPIITGDDHKYSIVKNEKCGVAKDFQSPSEIVDAIKYVIDHPIPSEHIKTIAKKYDYEVLTKQLVEIISQ